MIHKIQIVQSLVYFIILLLLAITGGLFLLEYEEVCSLLIKCGEIDRLEEFKVQFFTTSTFLVLRITFVSFSILSILQISQLNRLLAIKLAFFQWVKSKLVSSWSHFSKREKQVIFILSFCLLVIRLLFLFHWEYYEDEAFSYKYLVSKGILTTLTYYPGPNNHVFYNFICSLLTYTGLPQLWVMRLPSVLISGVMFYVSIPILKMKFNFRTSIVISILTQVCFNFFLYSFQGRGYALEVFLVLIAFYGLFKFSIEKEKNFLYLFVVSSILGFYTIPVFVYPFISIVTLNMLLQQTTIKVLLYSCFVVVMGTVFCYLPIFIISGISSVVANDWVKSLGIINVLYRFPSYVLGLQDWLWDFPTYGTVISGGLFFPIVLKFKNQKWFWISVMSFSLPVCLIILQGVLPFPRIWTYVVLLQGLSLGVLFDYVKIKQLFYGLIILFILSQFYSFYIIL